MNDPQDASRARLRKTVYMLLAVIATGGMLGRILAVDSVDREALQRYRIATFDRDMERRRQDFKARGASDEQIAKELARFGNELQRQAQLQRPFLSANDRSRWCTLRALVEKEMRVDGAPYSIDKVVAEPTWDTIDMVKHDGHLYSSKPPLFPTLVAADYWLIHRVTGFTLGTHPYVVGRILLICVNVLPLLIYFWLLAGLIERFGTTDWGRIFVMAAATLGTFLTTFAIVLNNHLPAAICALIALIAAVRIWFDNERRWRYFLTAGLFATFCAANELPAAAFAAALSLALLWKAPKQTLLVYVPGALVVLAGFFGTNWVAHQSLRPPYMHRSETDPTDHWYTYVYEHEGRDVKSYWQEPVGIDRGESSVGTYALHVLVGHHGIFSLTPVWLLSVLGLGIWLAKPPDVRLGELALLIAVVSVICLVFYLARPLGDRNYGGMTCGFRWMFWFAPLWLTAMLPAADALAGRVWTRGAALVLLLVSVLSATYPTWNPWTHPWLLNFLHYLGWITV